MADRYYVDAPIAGEVTVLRGQEAHHLAHVMRAKPGTQVTLFDGTGAEFDAEVVRVGRSEIELTVLERQQVDRESSIRVTLGVALPKGDRPRWLVEKATELGVARLVPLLTERSNQRESPAAMEKLRRAVIEASKQCGRNRLMEITEPVKLADYLAGEATADLRLIAHPGGQAFDPSITKKESVSLAIGPEGGFSEREEMLARELGWQSVDLGARILRVETAATALVAKLL